MALILILIFMGKMSPFLSQENTNLKEGMYWKIKSTRIDEMQGTMQYEGSFRASTESSAEYRIERIAGYQVHIVWESQESVRIESSGYLKQYLDDNAFWSPLVGLIHWNVTSGLFETKPQKPVSSWEISLKKDFSYDVSGLTPASSVEMVLINPNLDGQGKKLRQQWKDLDLEKFDMIKVERDFEVSTANMNIKGFQVEVWDVHYAGYGVIVWDSMYNRIGNFYCPFVSHLIQDRFEPTKNTATRHYFYEKFFGIFAGAKIEGENEFRKERGIISHRFTTVAVFESSNMWNICSFDVDPRITGLTIDNVQYDKDELPKDFLFPSGSIHTLEASSEVTQDDVKYTFQKWSDGNTSGEIKIIADKVEGYVAYYGIRQEPKTEVATTTSPTTSMIAEGTPTTEYSALYIIGAIIAMILAAIVISSRRRKPSTLPLAVKKN